MSDFHFGSSPETGRVGSELMAELERREFLNEWKFKAGWTTFGKSGKKPGQAVRLIDCATDHLQAILKTQPHIDAIKRRGVSYRDVIKSILDDRKASYENN